jgi:predicted nucleic acid-binding OB-fold protein
MSIEFNSKTGKFSFMPKEPANVCENCIKTCKKKRILSCIGKKTFDDLCKEQDKKSLKSFKKVLSGKIVE